MMQHVFTRLAAGSDRDLAARPWAVVGWILGAAVIALGFWSESLRPIAWTVGFGASGILCTVNAFRSRRFHCAFTGPLFLVGALLTVARAIGWITFSWNLIGWTVVASVLGFVIIEVVSGKRRLGGCC